VADVDNDPVQDADEVREVLNDQFGSIKIVERGKFELDLMEMFESDDYIIQLGEDGRYMVESMSTWKPGTRICNVIRWGGSPRHRFYASVCGSN